MQLETTNMTKFCQNGNVPRTTLLTYLKYIPHLVKMKRSEDKNLEEVEKVYDMFIQRKTVQRGKQLEKAHEANLYPSKFQETTETERTVEKRQRI